jgi:hypothetical protein
MRFAVASALLVTPLLASPANAGFLDFLFGPQNATPQRQNSQQQQSSFDPFGLNKPAQPPQDGQYPYVEGGGGRASSYCVRTCDGRYFPIQSSSASAAQVCQSFCPASATKVFYGSNISSAHGEAGGRYGDLQNAFLFRQKLVPGCTCNGRDSMGLAPVDLSLDQTLRPGDVVATTTGLVAYNGGRTGQTGEFTPVSSYPGLSSDVRTRLGEMKVAPSTDTPEDIYQDVTASIPAQSRAQMR